MLVHLVQWWLTLCDGGSLGEMMAHFLWWWLTLCCCCWLCDYCNWLILWWNSGLLGAVVWLLKIIEYLAKRWLSVLLFKSWNNDGSIGEFNCWISWSFGETVAHLVGGDPLSKMVARFIRIRLNWWADSQLWERFHWHSGSVYDIDSIGEMMALMMKW
jgi:hypothetical protein